MNVSHLSIVWVMFKNILHLSIILWQLGGNFGTSFCHPFLQRCIRCKVRNVSSVKKNKNHQIIIQVNRTQQIVKGTFKTKTVFTAPELQGSSSNFRDTRPPIVCIRSSLRCASDLQFCCRGSGGQNSSCNILRLCFSNRYNCRYYSCDCRTAGI